MASGPHAPLIGFLRRLATPEETAAQPDGELLRRFAQGRDEAAFAELIRRHGPLVLAACRRMLRSAADVEDAFQAVFLVLARRADAVGRPERLGPWLYGVAVRVARKARDRGGRYQGLDAPEELAARAAGDPAQRESEAILDEELDRLPEKYRTPLVLCCLQGLSREEAAARLGQSPGAVKGLLERGRERLRLRLEKRGVPASLPVFVNAAPPARLADAAARAAAGQAVEASVATLAEGVIENMHLLKWKMWLALALAVLACAGVGLAAVPGKGPAVVVPVAAVREVPPGAQENKAEEKPEPKKAELDLKARVAALAWSADAGMLAAACGDGVVRVWEPAADRVHELKQHKKAVVTLAWSRDGKALASGGEDGKVIIWDAKARKALATIEVETPAGLAFSPDGKTLGGSARSQDVRIWDARTGKEVRRIQVGDMKEGVCSLAFSPDGKQILTGGQVTLNVGTNWTTFRLLDAETGKVLGSASSTRLGAEALKRTADHLAPVAFSPDGKTWSGAASDDVIALGAGNTFASRHRGVSAVAFSADGKVLISAGREGTIRFTGVAKRDEVAVLKGQGVVLAVALSPDGRRLAWANEAGKVKLADPAKLQRDNAVKAK